MKRLANSQVIGLVSVVLVILLIAFLFFLKSAGRSNHQPSNNYSPAIPESSAEAKGYIDRASAAADANDFASAISILDEAIIKFPDDQNLELTREYYSIQKHANE